MNETLHQLGGLLLGSVPTIFLFLLLVILYRFLVYGPLTRVLNERRELGIHVTDEPELVGDGVWKGGA